MLFLLLLLLFNKFSLHSIIVSRYTTIHEKTEARLKQSMVKTNKKNTTVS